MHDDYYQVYYYYYYCDDGFVIQAWWLVEDGYQGLVLPVSFVAALCEVHTCLRYKLMTMMKMVTSFF